MILIDADEARENMLKLLDHHLVMKNYAADDATQDCIEVLNEATVVDAVEVVRCKDCKYKGWIQEPCHGRSVDFCHVWDCTLRNIEKTFCSYGERKEVSEDV